MTDQLDLRDLRYFEVIADTGHLGRAAKRLFRSQPALTGCVRRLEATLGTRLFEKAGRNIRLTPAGRALAARAQMLRVAARDTAREISELGKGVAGHIRVGVLPTLARFLLPRAMPLYLKESRDVTVRAVVAQNDVLAAQLQAGDLDIILTTRPGSGDPFVGHPLCEDEAVVIASRSHPIFRHKKIRMPDLLAYRWVLAPEIVGTRDWLSREFLRRGLPSPRVQIETNLILMMPALIEETEFLTFTSRRHVAPHTPGSKLREVPLRETTMRRPFEIVYRKGAYLSPAGDRFVELLSKHGARLFGRA